MIKLLAISAVTGVALSAAAVVLPAGKTEVVVGPQACPSVRFAAEEMTNLLSQTFGSPVEIVSAPRSGFVPIFLGDSEASRAAGAVTNGLKRDAFVIKAGNGQLHIVGVDDPKTDTRRAVWSKWTGVWDQLHEHATLFGVYEFLDRYAGVRMYFPGELGTIVPRKDRVEVPDGTETVTPDFLERNVSWFADGEYFEGEDRKAHLKGERKLNYQRNRMQTVYIPCCHGENGFNLLARFAESHPEYFVLKANGERRTQKGISFEGHLCHSSDVWNEIYEDIVSYAKGDSPTVRGVSAKGWPIMTFRRPWVDVMPQDGFQPCQCPQCKAAYNTNEFHYATELVWGRTVELAKKLKAANVPIRITQMAYTPYRRIPKIDIPDNVDVMVAEGGPWSVSNPKGLARELEEIRGWSEKLGHKVWIWTYPGKYGSMNIPDIPNTAPRAWHRYYKLMSPYIFGSFAESENDRWLYNYLNYYVFGKFCWNNKVDVEAILDEHFRLMFGAAAAPMAEFIRQVEDKWVNEVAGRLVDTDLGPARQPPSTYELFTRVYSPELLSAWKALFDRAFAAVPKGSLEHRRVALYAREFLVPLKKASKAYLASVSVEGELKARSERPERPNLFVNGDFSYGRIPGSKRHYGKTEKSQWKGGWIGDDRDEKNVSIVKTGLPEGIPAAMRIEVKDQPKTVGFTEHFQYAVGHLKPGQKYRISLFVKLENVVSHGKGGGFGMRVWDDKNVWFPERRITGTTDWIHQAYTFTAGPKSEQYANTCTFYLWNATGTLWVAGARFEEVE